MERRLMIGNEAIAVGAWEAGVGVCAAYPGTPSTEISEFLARYEDVYAEWSPNEKVAAEVAIGASIGGARAMCAMKHVGLNVAADPIFAASYTGVGGGLVVCVADDPGIYSSQNEQDTRMIARAAGLPVLEPSDSQEAKDYMKAAFDISEKYDTPVILRTTTRLAHSQSLVTEGGRVIRALTSYARDIPKYVMMPINAKRRHLAVEARNKALALERFDAGDTALNRIERGEDGGKAGFITSGIPYQYVKEAAPKAAVLKLGIVNPLPRGLIEEFAKSVEALYIFEELEPVIEEQVKSWGIKCVGKEIFTIQGEYSAGLILERVYGEKRQAAFSDLPASEAPPRPPVLCPGCPHRVVFTAIKELGLFVSGDIGCYTLGAAAPFVAIDTTLCMGASISMLHGIEKARGREFTKKWVAVIGDSTFMHTGVNSLINMAYNQAASTVIILDNSTTGMTGHQSHAATGKNLKGEDAPAVDIAALCEAIGVGRVITVDARDLPAVCEAIKTETAADELSVIIAKAPCVLLKRGERA